MDLTKLTMALERLNRALAKGPDVRNCVFGDVATVAAECGKAAAAFEVMMRRGWSLERNPGNLKWYVLLPPMKQFPTILSLERVGWVHYHEDPFTALVEADRWYREHIEKQL